MVVLATVSAGLWSRSYAIAAETNVAWRITDSVVPTHVAPGGSGVIALRIENQGSESSPRGSPITVVDQLPASVVASRAGSLPREGTAIEPSGLWGECSISDEGHTVKCTDRVAIAVGPAYRTYFNLQAQAIGIEINALQNATSGEANTATVSGGGGTPASDAIPIEISSSPAPFGVASVQLWATNLDGTPATQAGSHPFETTATVVLNTKDIDRDASGSANDLDVELPEGFVGVASAVPRCSTEAFEDRGSFEAPDCPPDTQVGVMTAELGDLKSEQAIYNLQPPPGIPARFGAALGSFYGYFDASVKPGPQGSYRLAFDTLEIHGGNGLSEATASIWGDPDDASHDAMRFPTGHGEPGGQDTPSGVAPKPFLRLPTSCEGTQVVGVSTHSVEEPLREVTLPGIFSIEQHGDPVEMQGCAKLEFTPSIEVTPESASAETPSGTTIDMKIPQNEDPNGLAEADLRTVSVSLPPGWVLSPSGAAGLQTCSEEQFGVTGTGKTLLFNESPVECPAASKLGSAEVNTPLSEEPIHGAVYLAREGENPFSSQLAAYVALEGSGALIKLAGELRLNQGTGRVTLTFQNNPQLPFSEIKVILTAGPNALLVTPTACGTYNTRSLLTPWSSSTPVALESPFTLTSGPGDGPCPTGHFAPSLSAAAANNQAGALTPYTINVGRNEGEEHISALQITMPPGLLGGLTSVTQCPESQANAGTCGAASQIGTASATAGAGPNPVNASGNVYLTGPYLGAPFGLSVVVPVAAGPFDLGTVVVRAAIYIEPRTAQLTVTTDPLPQILHGIPLDLRAVTVNINRSKFLFNPTKCTPSGLSGTAISSGEKLASMSSPASSSGCAKLAFKPKLTAVTMAGGEFTGNGASLHIAVSTPEGQANIRSLKVDLPQRLPARLESIQHACPAHIFQANPGSCPHTSIIGTATASTPLLGSPMQGPIFLVTHSGGGFPNMVVVLQADGVTIELTGALYVSANNITSTTFRTMPDVPIRNFSLNLPEGPNSALAASARLCGKALHMFTAITGQNGVQVKPRTIVAVSGCRAKKAPSKLKAGH
jgi:hypothetical protein